MFLVTLADVRDVVVIIYGVMGVVLMLALAIAAFGVWFAIRALTRQLRALLDDPVRPTLEEIRKTAENVRGTSEFMSDAAVHPIIRVIAAGRGVRRGAGVVTGIRNLRSKK
ncbi:MAG: hypothetical protein O2822_04165 [Chloroflexi bacterium]|nr:hypothetical protein [Chloroflexota bacterium]